MTPNIRILSLVVVGALAMSAIAASAAQGAWEFGASPAYLTGAQINHGGKTEHQIKAGKHEISCPGSFSGEAIGKKVEKITLFPNYGECKTEGGLPATITKNGCDYTLYGGTKTEGNEHHFTGGTFAIDCPPGAKIEIHIYAKPEKHAKGESLCTVTIPEQAVPNSVTFTNTTGTPDDVDITTEAGLVTELDNTEAGGCGEGAGSFTGATTLRAYSDAAHTKQITATVVP
jgi:hypothetical protein